MTHTYALLNVSRECFEEIAAKLKKAKYTQAFHEREGVTVIDMEGIALKAEEKKGNDPEE